MTKIFKNKFERIPLTADEKSYLSRQFSLRKIFLGDTVLFVPFLLLGFVCCFFPWFPHPIYGFGVQNPSSIKNYFEIVGLNMLSVLIFVMFLILLMTTINFFRAKFDSLLGFKKVGIFEVTSITQKRDVLLIRLGNGKRMKRKSSEIPFNKLVEQDIVEISESATNRPISFRIVNQ